MIPDPAPAKTRSYLRRLPPEAYQGSAAVHWSMTLKCRALGWLDEPFHLRFRELLLHAAFRYRIAIPAYCLMPDHFHLLACGYHDLSDQREAMAFLRTQVNSVLKRLGYELQKQAYDHVLDDEERQDEGLQQIGWYIWQNPLRAGLVPDAESLGSYPYLGCLLPGFPEVSIWDEEYWKRFWRIYAHYGKRHP